MLTTASCSHSTAADGCFWCSKDAACLSVTPAVIPGFTCAAEDFTKTCLTENNNPYPDPLFDSMNWIYDMINVKEVWAQGISKCRRALPQGCLSCNSNFQFDYLLPQKAGKDVSIRINDSGLDETHPDFSSKFDQASSCANFRPVSLEDPDNFHGTTVAAVTAAAGNDKCSVGIAPDATLSACESLTLEGYEYLSADQDTDGKRHAQM